MQHDGRAPCPMPEISYGCISIRKRAMSQPGIGPLWF